MWEPKVLFIYVFIYIIIYLICQVTGWHHAKGIACTWLHASLKTHIHTTETVQKTKQ